MNAAGCPWRSHNVTRHVNDDGTVTLTLDGWRYTTSAERDPGTHATCRWCKHVIHRDGLYWRDADGQDCPDAGPTLPYHSPEPLPQTAAAAEPCLTRTVPIRWTDPPRWAPPGEKWFTAESGTAAEMVAEHIGEPWTVVWQGRGWTVELRSGYPLWQVTC